MSCLRSADDHLGPRVATCLRSFDFTIAFEETIFSLIPGLLFLLLGSIRLWRLKGRAQCTDTGALYIWKLITIAAYAAVQLSVLILAVKNNHNPGLSSQVIVVAAAVSFITACVLGLVSSSEHKKTVNSSTLLAIYLLFTAILDIARVRTQWLAGYSAAFAGLLATSLALKIATLLVEAQSKLSLLKPHEKQLGPEELSGFYSKSLFLWLNPLLRLGFSKVFTLNDLYCLDEQLLSASLVRKFEPVWLKSQKSSSNALLVAILKTLFPSFAAPFFPRILLLGFTFAQPLLIQRVLSFFAAPNGPDSNNIGYGLIGAYVFTYSGIALSTGWYQYLVYRFITMFRGILVPELYIKTLDVSIVAASNSAALVLMSTDVERVMTALPALHEIWVALAQVAIAAWLLQRELGFPFFLPIVLSLVCALVAVALSILAGHRQKAWLEAIRERLSITGAMLKSMKSVKLSGLTENLTDVIAKLRAKEITSAFKFRILLLSIITIAFIPQTMAPLLTFGVYLAKKNSLALRSEKLFSSLLLLRLITQPMNTVFQAAPTLMSAMACLGRIQAFILDDSRKDTRTRNCTSNATNPSAANLKTLSNMDSTAPSLDEASTFCEKKDVTTLSAISVRDGSFGWKPNDPAILQDINLDIEFSSLTMIVGPVASGKSTLLKGLLGELPKATGCVDVARRRIAFCDQTPWITNATLQQNILGYSVYERDWYKTVVHACVLDQDLAALPDGDQSVVGSNGINLSGGQKQRLTIARAIYSKHDIIIMDDVLSGLDLKTESELFSRLLGVDGLLRKSNTAIVLATNAVHLLPFADHIISLGSEGSISEVGSFHDLRSANGYVASLDIASRTENVPGPLLVEDSAEYRFGKQKAAKANTEITRQLGDGEVYMYYFRSNGLRNYAFYFGLQIAWATMGNFPTLWLQWWANAITAGDPRNAHFFGGYAGFQVAYLVVLAMLAVHVFLNMQVKSGNKLHLVLLKAVMAAPMSFFNITDSGVILNIFSQDLQLLDAELPFALQNVIANALNSIAQAILILPVSYWLAISFPFLIGAFYTIQKFYLRTSRQLRLLDIEAKSPLYTTFTESLAGLPTIRAFGWQQDLIKRNEENVDMSQKPFYLLFCVQRWLTLVLDLVVAGLATVVIVVAVKLKDVNTAGFSGVALFNLSNLAQTMTTTVTTWTLMEAAMGAVARIKTFEKTTPTEHLHGDSIEPPRDWPSAGEVSFNDVCATYKDGSVKALNNLSITVRAGEKVGICGRSGSGKSSFMLALFRMIDMPSGNIIIDGVDISTISLNTLRSRLNAISQEPCFFGGSVRVNIDPNNEASEAAIYEILERSKLQEAIEKMGGLDAEMNAELLSHGQRQLFCLARALLCKCKIVVLDEATASVDVEVEHRMQEMIRSVFTGCTVIAIAHRLETIMDFDRIAVMEKGSLVECDTPAALLARDSAFKRLYEANRGQEGIVEN